MTHADGELTVEVLRGFDRWLAVADEWEELCDAAERPLPYLRRGWVRAGWELQPHGLSRLLTVLVRERGRLVMAGLFELGFRGLGPVVRVPYPGVPQLDDIVWRRSGSTERQARLLLEALRGALWLPRFFRSGAIRAGSPLLAAAEAMGLPRRSRRTTDNHVVPLADYPDFASYLQARGNNLRLDHGRRLRRIHDSGRFELERTRTPEVLAWLLEHKLAWVDRTGRNADWLTTGYTARFLERALLAPGAQPWSIWTASLDGRCFAATLCLEEPGLWHPFMVAQDPALDRLSPGRTLTLLVIEQAFAAGIGQLDLGITNPHWKDRLGAAHQPVLNERIRLR